MASLTFLTLALHAITAYSCPYHNQTAPTATLDSGVVVGTTTSVPSSEVTVNQFLGIPFGEPPVRFGAPQAVAPWGSVYDASAYKPACLSTFPSQEPARSELIKWFQTPGPPAGESEDCLNLNVFAPAGATKDPKAVMFWMYGGAFAFGTGSLPLYDGSYFAAKHDVVVVTINYRVSAFGFPGSPDANRNFGFLDQRLALDWVQRNIAALGGDPAKVTIFGESAGSGSADVLITNPPDPLPFRAAIMQSGQASVFPKRTESVESWLNLTEAANCPPENQLECMRAIPAFELRALIEEGNLLFYPTQDDDTWSETARLDRLASTEEASSIARVPILIGTNAQEAKADTRGLNDTAKALEAIGLGAFVPIALHEYPLGTPGLVTENDRITRILTEVQFQCGTKIVAEETAKVGIPSWRYFYNSTFPNSEIFPGSGAYHTAEIALVFGTYKQEGATELQAEVSDAMQTAWANFAKDPTAGPGWEAVPKVQVIGAGEGAKKVMETVDAKVVDRTCSLYKGYLDGISLVRQ